MSARPGSKLVMKAACELHDSSSAAAQILMLLLFTLCNELSLVLESFSISHAHSAPRILSHGKEPAGS
jgi:hypothetical protein